MAHPGSHRPIYEPHASELATRGRGELGRSLSHWLGGLAILESLIGVIWQRLFARSLALDIPYTYSALLGLSLWLVYIADRWLDARRSRSVAPLSARHELAFALGSWLVAAWCLVLLGTLAIASLTLDSDEWAIRVGLLLITFGYFASVHWLKAAVPKEALVTAIYTAGVTLYTWDKHAWTLLDPAPLLGVLAFALLVALNLGVISVREQDLDAKHGSRSIALSFAHLARACSILSATLCLASLALSHTGGASFQRWFYAVASSSLALGLLPRVGKRFDLDAYHLLADATLLLALPFAWLC